jgi:hypothetical protein
MVPVPAACYEKSPAVLLRRFEQSSLISPCDWRGARGEEVEEVGEGAAGSAVSSGHFPENSWQYSSVADPDPGLGAFFTPGSGIRDGRKSASGSGIRDEQPGSYF